MAVGDPNLYFGRDTKVYLAQNTSIWEIPVLNGYAFSQATNTSEVTLSEMSDAAGVSRRARQMFTDSLAPATWSFSTYVRPFNSGTAIRSVEEPLWANFVANNQYDPAGPAWTSGVTLGGVGSNYDLSASNSVLIGTFTLYFVLGGSKAASANYGASEVTTIYEVSGCSINEVAITFDINGIATLAWSGSGARVREIATLDASTAIRGGIDATNNFIRNRLTQLVATSSVSGSPKTYALTLTGGTITMTNNLTYLTPEVLGKVNVPFGHVTGTRTIGGSFTCYLDERTNGSIDLFQDLTSSNALNKITNAFALDFYVGGKAGSDDAPVSPGLQFKIPHAHLMVPTFDNGDVVSVAVDFAALPSTISATDEVTYISVLGPIPA